MKKKAWNKRNHSQYIKQLKIKGIEVEPIQEYIDDSTKILHRCICGHEWMVRPNHVLKGVKCEMCRKARVCEKQAKSQNDYVKEIEELKYGIEVIGQYVNNHTKIAHKCPICKREDWMITPVRVRSGDIYMCADCSRQYFESRHATVLKQIYKKYLPSLVWEDCSCINPLNGKVMPTDMVDYENKISIEIQSEYHDNDYCQYKDLIKKEFWENKGFTHYQLDIRDYTILEMVQVFFKELDKIPDWVAVIKPLSKKKWNVDEAQGLLNKGLMIKEVAEILGISQSNISNSIKKGELHKVKNKQYTN